MLENKKTCEKMVVRICSRPDLGMVEVLDVIKFSGLHCVKTSKGGIFDRFDIVGVTTEEAAIFKSTGESFSHSKKDWLKKGSSMAHTFFCTGLDRTVNIGECKNCYETRINRIITRAECKEKHLKEGSRIDINPKDTVRKETAKPKTGILEGLESIQDLRVKQLEELNKVVPQ